MKKFLWLVVLFFTAISFSCFRKPKWQTDITIPLLSKFYSIQNFIDTSYIKINSDSSINFFVAGNLDTIALLDSIQISNKTDSVQTKLSDFNFNSLASATVILSPDEVTGVPLPETTVNITIPPYHRTINKTLKFPNIGNVIIDYGVMKITIINNSRLTFDTINCSISNYEIIHLTDIDSISTTEFVQHLNNVALESIATFDIYFASQGTNGFLIPLSKYDSIEFQVKFDSLRIDTACFRSNPPRLVRTHKTKIFSIPTNYQFRISDLIFNSGYLSLNLLNQFPLSIAIQCTIPELQFDTILSISPFSTTAFNINLAGRTYHNSSDSVTPITLRTGIEFQLDSNYVCFGPQNSIKVTYAISDIHIDSIAGTVLDTIRRSFQKDSIPINLPDFLKNVTATNVFGTLSLTNAIAFPIQVKINASAVAHNGFETIDTTLLILPGTPNNPYIKSVTINFTDLFNIHPSYISLNIQASSIGSGWMSRSSYCTASYFLTCPLRIILQSDTLTFNPTQIKISENVCSMVRDYGDSSVFFARVQNHIPVRLTGDIILADSKNDSVRLNLAIPSGIIDINSGQVITSSDSTIAIVLNPSATEIFTDSLINISVILYIPQTDTIMISGRDYFRIVNSYAQIYTKPVLKEKNNR